MLVDFESVLQSFTNLTCSKKKTKKDSDKPMNRKRKALEKLEIFSGDCLERLAWWVEHLSVFLA